MDQQLQQLVIDVMNFTGATKPALMDENAPVLRHEDADAQQPYLVGLIGGKEVGKSALVNALIGRKISPSTSYGPGTEIAVAFAHKNQAQSIRQLLEAEAPGRFRIIGHDHADLSRQVLLDLPDIDSHYEDHLELTRRLLRHMLFPIWIQSVEKYADIQPQKLLAAVAQGNDPDNFLFVLNKLDQVRDVDDADAASELRTDYAERIAKTLSLPWPPRIYLISATHPDDFDFPELRAKLAQQKSEAAVHDSIELAGKQRGRTLVAWLDEQNLPARGERLARLQHESEELAASRLGVPLVENLIPRILDDPAHRLAMIDEVMSRRVSQWPIVNLIHPLLAPLTALWRRNAGIAQTPEQVIELHQNNQAQSLSSMVQTTFALLQQTHSPLGAMFRERKLWEDVHADAAALELKDALATAMQRQRESAIERIAGEGGVFSGLFRCLLTIGALVWFPFLQPVLEITLQPGGQLPRIALLVVQLLGVTYLLKSAIFLAIWFVVLWLALRWDTQRRVNRLLEQWSLARVKDPSLSLSQTTLEWIDGLLDPVRQSRERVDDLVQRAESLRQSTIPAAAA